MINKPPHEGSISFNGMGSYLNILLSIIDRKHIILTDDMYLRLKGKNQTELAGNTKERKGKEI